MYIFVGGNLNDEFLMDEKLKIVCFGEVLWDIFPGHKKIGGAPLNVALRLSSFGLDVSLISRIGNDSKGSEILSIIRKKGVHISYIQRDGKYKTGEVEVELNSSGSASYKIVYPSAWDKIQVTENSIKLVRSADAFVFGSLVARDEVSKHSLFEFIEKAKYKIFDINLRPPFYSKEILLELAQKADFIKLNEDELFEITGFLDGHPDSIEQNIRFLSEMTNTKQICVTKGKRGAVLFFKDRFYHNRGYQVEVKDTVGAGDSFLAALISQLLKNTNPQNAIDFACAVGALVAQSEGANPTISLGEIESLIKIED